MGEGWGGREEALDCQSGGWVLVPCCVTFHKLLSLSGPWQDGAGLSLKVPPPGTSRLQASPSLYTPQSAAVPPKAHWPSHLNMKSAFFSGKKLGQLLLKPEPAESELLAHICTLPLHTPAQSVEGVGREAWGAREQLLGMLSLAWAPAHLLEPHPTNNPWVSKKPPLCRGLWDGAGLGRAQGQGGRADSAVGEAPVRPQLQAGLEIYSVLTGPGSSPFTCLLWDPGPLFLQR